MFSENVQNLTLSIIYYHGIAIICVNFDLEAILVVVEFQKLSVSHFLDIRYFLFDLS